MLTSCCIMAGSIKNQADVHMSHSHPMPNAILLQGLTIQDCNFECPKTRNSVEDHRIPPEPFIQYLPAVLFVTEGLRKGGSQISQAICLPQVWPLVHHDSLSIADQPVGHLPTHVSGRIIRMAPVVHHPHAKTFLHTCVQAVAHAAHQKHGISNQCTSIQQYDMASDHHVTTSDQTLSPVTPTCSNCHPLWDLRYCCTLPHSSSPRKP